MSSLFFRRVSMSVSMSLTSSIFLLRHNLAATLFFPLRRMSLAFCASASDRVSKKLPNSLMLMSTISSSDAGNRDAPEATNAGLEPVKSLGAFVGVNRVGVLVDGLDTLPLSGFSCLIVALVNRGRAAACHSPFTAGVKDVSTYQIQNSQLEPHK